MDVYQKLAEKEVWARAGGRNTERGARILENQLFVRDRIRMLFDAEPDFEDGLLAGCEKGVPADAVVTAIGSVSGRKVAVIANDFTESTAKLWYGDFFISATNFSSKIEILFFSCPSILNKSTIPSA